MKAGYDDTTLDACPYDWRLPPEKMDERDNFFGKMKKKIEGMVDHLGRPIVLLAHSMGNRVVQYFLEWIVTRGEREWIDRYIYSYLAIGSPFLGASKTIRTVLCGDAMGLDVFLTKQEALYMARASASLPWLFPMQESLYPDDIMRVGSEKEGGGGMSHVAVQFPTVLHSHIPRTQKFYEEFYLQNPLYMATSRLNQEKDGITPRVLCPPPVKRIWVLNGINRTTEIGYYLKSKKAELDPSVDKASGKKLAGINPRGLLIQDGIAYEGSDTYQPSIFACKSGDGTVPFCSLNYAEIAWSRDVHVYTVEVEDAEHREMLNNDACIGEILNLVCIRNGGR